MSKIYGSLHVTNSDWRYVYATILNYFNQEINLAFKEAMSFWQENNHKAYDAYNTSLKNFFKENEVTAYRQQIIMNSMFKTGTKIFKPKKNFFNKITNRATYINALDVTVQLDKDNRSLFIETLPFDDFDKYIANASFITEFINMVNCINWPTRTGPNKTIRGCTLIRTTLYDQKIEFFKSGPNPPTYPVPSEVCAPPMHMESHAMKNIKLTSSNPEDTYQPNPVQQDLTGM
jgi:hypothetical protein